MTKYILATRLSPKYLKELLESDDPGKQWLDEIKKRCPEVKFHAHYFILGPYDFFDIFEAPNEEVAAKVSLITQSMGATLAQTWTIMEYQKFRALLKDL